MIKLAKHFYGVRFRPSLYRSFKQLAKTDGYTVTGAFERFMACCLDTKMIVFPDTQILNFKAETHVLLDWLEKGEYHYRTDNGEEHNIRGRLFWLLPRVADAALEGLIEEALKKSVPPKD